MPFCLCLASFTMGVVCCLLYDVSGVASFVVCPVLLVVGCLFVVVVLFVFAVDCCLSLFVVRCWLLVGL